MCGYGIYRCFAETRLLCNWIYIEYLMSIEIGNPTTVDLINAGHRPKAER